MKYTFEDFLDYFPEFDLPLSLLPDLDQIPSDDAPIAGELIDKYILPFEASEGDDEYVEYIPYGRFTSPNKFQAIIYWKAGVLRYEFILATYTLQGEPLSHAIVGGLRYEEEGALHSVGVIQPDYTIVIAEGLLDPDTKEPDLTQTQTYNMSIGQEGIIEYQTNEEES